MPLRYSSLILVLLLCLPAQARQSVTADQIRNRIEVGTAFSFVETSEGRIRSFQATSAFYRNREFEPVWTEQRLGTLLGALEQARSHALDPEDYRLSVLRARLTSGQLDIDTELMATDAFMLYGSHLHEGRVNPETLEAEWTANRRTTRMEGVLEAALQSGNLPLALEQLAPQQPRYRQLRRRYTELGALVASPSTRVPDGPKLERGVDHERISALRARLVQLGDLDAAATDGTIFDDDVHQAVVTFQLRHGLDADGVVGPATLREMNRTWADRRQQVAANMERWRWLPDSLGDHHIEVNLAGFEVTIVKDRVIQRRHRAIVGRAYRETPMFSGTMTYLVLAPYWNVPPTIASQDKFPQIKKDPGYVAAQRMVMFDQKTGTPVDPFSVDFTNMTGREFNSRYRLRQEPGPTNALGDVKFMFPNRHHVYLHDTPGRELFSQTARSFSSGCIRIDNPLELAAHLLEDQSGWTPQRIRETVASGKEVSVSLTTRIPVHLLYWTVWVGPDGSLQFREDIYGRDATVLKALVEAPVGS